MSRPPFWDQANQLKISPLNYERCVMKIVVIGGGGLIGKKLVSLGEQVI